MYTKSMRKGQILTITGIPVDSLGKETSIDGKPDWRTDNPAVVELTETANGQSVQVKGVGFGVAKVTQRGDADLTTATSFVETFAEITVTGNPAVGFALTITEPVDAPA